MHELHAHNVNGKGDKERSPGWRENYPAIYGEQTNRLETGNGFVRVSLNRIRKTYRTGARPGEHVDKAAVTCCDDTVPCACVPPVSQDTDCGVGGCDGLYCGRD